MALLQGFQNLVGVIDSCKNERFNKMTNTNYENDCPSPDRSGNPFVPEFGTKDWNG
jgi:hypothetical protein